MALELRQQLKLAQQLVMTPQLQQAIKLLQLSRVELLETVQQEMLDNPFLEELSGDESSSDQAAQTERREAVEEEVYDKELAKDASWEDYLGEFASTPRQVQPRDFEAAEEISPLEARYAAKPTLEGHLLWQLRLSMLTEAQKEIGEVIIGNLASSGYLQATLEEIAEMTTSTPDEVRAVLERVQLFDPIGVAARDARECLLIQLKSLNYDRDPILLDLVQSHLEDLEAKRYKPLLRKFKLDMEELKEYLNIIQSLDRSALSAQPVFCGRAASPLRQGQGRGRLCFRLAQRGGIPQETAGPAFFHVAPDGGRRPLPDYHRRGLHRRAAPLGGHGRRIVTGASPGGLPDLSGAPAP